MPIFIKRIFPLFFIFLVFISGCYQDFPPGTTISEISAEEAHKLIEENTDNPDFMIVDVRSENEFTREHIPGAVNLRYTADDFIEKMLEYGKDKTYLVYCLSGGRSRSAIKKLIPLGFTHLYNMDGGIIDWKDAGYEVISE